MPQLDRDILLQTLAGYAEVNKITEAERRARLRAMTDAEARSLFDELCASWDKQGKQAEGDWQRLDRRRIEHKVELRRKFERLAHHKGFL